MQTEGKKDGVAVGAASDLNVLDADAGLASALREIIEQVDAHVPLGAIRQTYAAPLGSLVSLAGQTRDVNMLARLHAVMSMLEADGHAPGEHAALSAQLVQVERMLRGGPQRSTPAAKGIIADQPSPAPPSAEVPASEVSVCEGLLRTLPSIGDQRIGVLKAQGLLDQERLLGMDALELARVGGLAANTAFEVKELLRRDADQRAKRDLERRVTELSRINEQVSAECDGIAAANNTLLMNNKSLKTHYPAVSEQHDLEVRSFRDLQSRVVTARLESNRLSTEINFLRDEHRKLLGLVEEKHVVLDDLLRRFNGVRCSFEFVSGETAAAQDVMTNVEGLLKKALMQKKVLNDKIASSEHSIEKLLSEFNEIVRRGKTEFYKSI